MKLKFKNVLVIRIVFGMMTVIDEWKSESKIYVINTFTNYTCGTVTVIYVFVHVNGARPCL
jgi:predicted double-glycine peptidase